MDGQPGPEYDVIGEGPVFSANSKRVAYVARKGKTQLVVVDGQPGPEYDGFGTGSLVFSADGKHVAYVAGKGQKQLVVVDGQPGPEHDGIVLFTPARLTFEADGSLEFLAVKADTLGRVRVPPVP